ncbi:MAG TPA: magnesium chelatase [Syntrophobacteraceae bacterium]|nr:magnesium chelatase [Syntrophobacteraceae bacterium]
MQPNFPFSALVGQDLMKQALLLNVVDPSLGGVLIKGERGTAKSTGVRALIDLLPTIRVVANCPFQCDPDDADSLCPYCREKSQGQQDLPAREQTIRLINLPIGTTEDRLLGTIDMEKALKSGKKAFEPGLLAEAHRGILYVDEVNLLNDQIVDLFLDTAASGTNVVEREGISFSHASRFILVGTMNPEEGDLRPQLHDRFGLSVTIEGIQSLPDRVEIIKRRLAFEHNPEGFRSRWAAADDELAQRIVRAKEALRRVAFTEDLLETAARLAVAMDTDGHRADIAMMKAARANAAFQGRARVTTEDLELAARLVLGHRVKKTPLQKAELDQEKIKAVLDHQGAADAVGEEWVPTYQNEPRKQQANTRNYKSPVSCVTHLCSGSHLAAAHVPWKALVVGNNPGRRFVLPDPDKGGGIHGCRFPRPGENIHDVSFVGTIRAAAPHQQTRGANGALRIRWDDLRLRKRSRKTSLAMMLIVDSSASMRTNDRMSVTKGIIEALLDDLYRHRDKLGIITFRHTAAEVIQPLTHNIRDAADCVERLPVGGRTPLAAGLALGIRMLSQEKRKNVESLPVILLFSDGRPNVSCFGQDPLDETFFYAREIKRLGIQAIFVDTETNPTAMGYGYEIAARMDAAYLPLDRLL